MGMMFRNLDTKYDRKYSDWQLLKRYSRYLKEQKNYLVRTLVAIVLATSFTLIIPFTLQIGIDSLIDGDDDRVILMTIAFMGSYALVWVFDFVRNYENTKFTSYSTQSIRYDLFSKVQFHDQSFFDENNTGLLQSRIMDDTQVLSDFVKLTSDFLVNMLIAFGTAIILFYIDWYLTLFALSVVPLVIILAIVFRKIARGLSRNWRIAIAKLNDSFQENISGISIARSFAREKQQAEGFDDLNRAHYRVNVRMRMFFSSIFPFVFVLSNIGLFLVMRFGGLQSIETGDPSPGTILMYIILLQRFYFPVILISTFYQQVQAGMAAAERIFSLMDVESKLEDYGTEEVNQVDGRIDIKNLNFSYTGRDYVFKNFNLSVKPGEKVAIVGHTGAGKSSLVSLLSRFYEYDGDILLDGKNIKDYKLGSYRDVLGLVLQDPFIFSGTIRDNIVYGKRSASDEEIMIAAQIANVADLISNFADGLETDVFEGGKKLSQGQKQLIAMARAFLTDPKILLMDEATASIDAYSEALIQEAIDRLLKNRTSIIIAHRLTTIKKVDRIIVLQKGEIIEEGKHSELLQKKGHYAELYHKYFEFQELQL
ncbi:MAG: ABC transporter ATP-binding protein [Candidatus Heimdallarchaeota archaeon]|nr:ABC transporter ATP-binding protein [Candidatus Heimdallarchaeota archaeon]